MELFYRGQSYQTASPEIEMTETSQIGTYRGKSYKIQQAKVTQRHIGIPLMYRGIDYDA